MHNGLTNSPKSKFKFNKKHLLAGVAAIAVIVIIFALIPSKSDKAVDHDVSVSAVNQAENANTGTDGYKINNENASTPVPQNQNSTASTSSLQTSTPTSVSDQLNSINAQLQSIQSALGHKAPGSLKDIKAQLNSVVYQIKDLISESNSDISQQIQDSSQTLQTELSGMKGQLTNIQQLSQPGSYIDASNLPFVVQFIDNVSGQNVVTVKYNNLLTPLSVGESLAGWTLINADYSSQYAVFQNTKDQLIKVNNNNAQGV